MCLHGQISLSVSLALASLAATFAQSAEVEGFRLFAQGKNQQAAVCYSMPPAPLLRTDLKRRALCFGLCSHGFKTLRQPARAFARLFGVPADSAKAQLLAAKMMMGENLEEMAEPELRAA